MRRIVQYAGLFALAVAPAACADTSTEPDETPSATPSAAPSPAADALPLRTLSRTPVSGSIEDIELRGGLVAYATFTSHRRMATTVLVDGEGRVLAELKDGDRIGTGGHRVELVPGDAPEISGGWGSPSERLPTPVVQYRKGNRAGLATLSPNADQVVVDRLIPVELPGRDPDALRLHTVDGRTALTEIGPDSAGPRTGVRTRAYDLETGRMLWEVPGRGPRSVLGDLVLLERPLDEWATDDPAYAVSAVDRATGADRWDLSKRYARSELIAAVGRTLVVEIEDEQVAVLDAASGRELTRQRVDPKQCAGEDERLIVCAPVQHGDLVVVRRHGSSATIGRLPQTSNRDLDGVWRQRIFTGAGRESVVLDPSGTRTSDRITGRLIAADGDRAGFVQGTPDEPGELTVVEAGE